MNQETIYSFRELKQMYLVTFTCSFCLSTGLQRTLMTFERPKRFES